MNERFKALKKLLEEMGGVAVAFSGGVDSTFLLAAAKEALGEKALAVIGRSPTYPTRELKEALALAKRIGVRCLVVDTDEISNQEFRTNPPHRCFVCKTILFTAIEAAISKEGIEQLLEGSNADDVGDFRPGLQACAKMGVRSPLRELDFTKEEIRELSHSLGLPTWDKPSFACLASRIPYGEEINEEKLARIEKAEDAVQNLGIRALRVRDHGLIARIEVGSEEISRLADQPMRGQLVAALKGVGYKFVSLDLEGYRTGAMNEMLNSEQLKKAQRRRD